MKEKPSLSDQRLVDHLHEVYGMEISRVEFLPIGDISSAKYRVVRDGPASPDQPGAYFLKLRLDFKEISVLIPHFLHERGIPQVLSPLSTKDRRLWSSLDAYTCILYPFIAGQNGFQDPLSDDQWQELGAMLKRVHTAVMPPTLQSTLPRETFSPYWRERVKAYLVQEENNKFNEPVAVEFAASLHQHRAEIRLIIERAGELAKALQSEPLERVLCHADIHAGNLLLENSGAVHIIDWDDPVLAPKERDLMFIGGGIGGIWNTAREEELFYQGYGEKGINRAALAYYRYERLVSDIGEFCQQILSTTADDADRERSLGKFYSAFLPGQTLEIAYQTDSYAGIERFINTGSYIQ